MISVCGGGKLHVYIDPNSDKVLVYCVKCKDLWRSTRQEHDEPIPLPEYLNEKYEMMYPQD